MCSIVVGKIDKWIVNLEIQFSINMDLLQFLCIIWMITIEHLPYICRRYLVTFGNVFEFHIVISNYINIIILSGIINDERVLIDVTKIKLMIKRFDNITNGNTMEIDMGIRLIGRFSFTTMVSLIDYDNLSQITIS